MVAYFPALVSRNASPGNLSECIEMHKTKPPSSMHRLFTCWSEAEVALWLLYDGAKCAADACGCSASLFPTETPGEAELGLSPRKALCTFNIQLSKSVAIGLLPLQMRVCRCFKRWWLQARASILPWRAAGPLGSGVPRTPSFPASWFTG